MVRGRNPKAARALHIGGTQRTNVTGGKRIAGD